MRMPITMVLLTMAAIAPALESRQINLYSNTTEPATIWRDNSGHLVFRDETTTATLSQLRSLSSNSHGDLADLDEDDHPHYLTATRHGAMHTDAFNDGLVISPDVAGNETLATHVQDATIHLSATEDELISGEWTFGNELSVLGGDVEFLNDGVTGYPSLRFVESATMAYDYDVEKLIVNKPLHSDTVTVSSELDGQGTAELVGFASINGIDISDLLSASASASITSEWSFYGGIRVVSSDMVNRGSDRIWVKNASASPVSKGQAMKIQSLAGEQLEVLPSLAADEEPFLGFAASDALSGQTFPVTLFGVGEAIAGGSISTGSALSWQGSFATTGGVTRAYALQSTGPSGGTIAVWITR